MSEPKTAEVKVVPVEPTEAMLIAGGQAVGWNPAPQIKAAYIFRKMVAAAPASPSAETGEGAFGAHFYAGLLDHAWTAFRERKPFQINADGAISLIQQAAADRAALSAQPVSPSEGEIKKTLTELRAVHSDMTPSQLERFDCDGAAFSILRAIRLIEKLTHPASDQSDTERMRAALRQIAAMSGWTERDGGQSLSDAVDVAEAALAEKAAD